MEDFRNNFNKDLTYLEHQLCALQEDEEHAAMMETKGKVNPNEIPYSKKFLYSSVSFLSNNRT